MLSSVEQAFVGREEIRAPLKTPAWEATLGDEREVSNPIEIRPIRLSRTSQSPSGEKVPEEGLHEGTCDGGHAGEQQPMQKGNAAVPAVPVLDKKEITFSDEIGRGSFGVVFKGSWASSVCDRNRSSGPRHDSTSKHCTNHGRVDFKEFHLRCFGVH